MRIINEIIIHCSDSPYKRDDTAKDIDAWHKQRGWRCIGYHYVIDLDGTIEYGRHVSTPGAHCYRHNAHSIGVCYIGGRDEHGNTADTRTPEQKEALNKLLYKLITIYRCPVKGHHDYDRQKDCPCFDAQKEYRNMYLKIVTPK